jgi:drug/metabolite transporter (DMT)-like permease
MRAIDWLLLVILSILWGATFFFVGIAIKEVPPFTLVLSRVVIAAAILIPLVAILGLQFPRTRDAWRDFLVMAIINNVIPFSLIFYGQTRIASGLASVLNASTPLFALLVARFVAGDALHWNKIAGILIGIAGVAVLIGPAAMTGKSADTLAMLAILGATLSYGFSGIWGRRLKTYPAVVSAASQLLCATVLLLPIAAAYDGFWHLPTPSQATLWAMLGLGVLSTALAYILFFRIMSAAGSTNVMLVTLLIPFSSIALGSAFLGESITTQQIIGAVIIGSGLLLIDGRLFGVPTPYPHQSR